MRAARSGGALSRRRIVRGLTVRMLRVPAKSFEVGEEGGTGMASPNARYFTTGARRAERAAEGARGLRARRGRRGEHGESECAMLHEKERVLRRRRRGL